MTSSQTPITSKPSLFSRVEFWVPAVYFLVFAIHGATIGLSDDEAYYWVLSRKPALGYAYHPPMVAWAIAAFSWLGDNAFTVRLPGILCITLVLHLALKWLRDVRGQSLGFAAAILFSFAGLFALSWMMVPDLPLILGFTLAFVATWGILFQGKNHWLALIAGIALSTISKYSGVAVGASAFLSLWIWAPKLRAKAFFATAVGVLLAATPILIWNAHHEWGSILYQIHDRHEGGSLSLSRYLRFWLIELFAAGPVLIGFAFWIFFKRSSRIFSYVFVWMLPAALVFCVEPIWSDFKPHWAFIVWWPAALALAATAQKTRAIKFQLIYGWTLGTLVLICCHIPLGGFFVKDPKMDVSNDLYAWSKLRETMVGVGLPVVGSRYQTASQAYFALGPDAHVTLLPRDLKARDEWPDLGVSDSTGPDWPTLKKPVIYVRDNRYSELPQYPHAKCALFKRIDETRFRFPAKWIELWRCDP